MTSCKSCNAPIRWALTSSGKRMPLDGVPVADGEWVIVDYPAVIAAPWTRGMENLPRFRTHFATCPNASQHRRVR